MAKVMECHLVIRLINCDFHLVCKFSPLLVVMKKVAMLGSPCGNSQQRTEAFRQTVLEGLNAVNNHISDLGSGLSPVKCSAETLILATSFITIL